MLFTYDLHDLPYYFLKIFSCFCSLILYHLLITSMYFFIIGILLSTPDAGVTPVTPMELQSSENLLKKAYCPFSRASLSTKVVDPREGKKPTHVGINTLQYKYEYYYSGINHLEFQGISRMLR